MDPLILLLYFAFVIPSAIFHEFGHAFAANTLGDPTPRLAGRLTLNPFPHIDLLGTLALPFLLLVMTGGQSMFAYAKPVPFNPYNLKKAPKMGSAIVGVAGPLSNLLLAVVFGMIAQVVGGNLGQVLSVLVYVNCGLMIFNLLPIPPLDGSKVLFAFFPHSWRNIQNTLENYGIVIFILLLGVISTIIGPLVNGLASLLLGF